MDDEGRTREEELRRAREEISGLRRRLAGERFAEELKDALTLAASAGEVSSPISHSRLLEMIVETAASVIPSRAASLFLIDEEAGELVFEVALGPEADEVSKFRVPLGHGIAGLVAITDGLWGSCTTPSPTRTHTGMACAGIIRSQAPDCELYGVKVLGPRLTGRGTTFSAGIKPHPLPDEDRAQGAFV